VAKAVKSVDLVRKAGKTKLTYKLVTRTPRSDAALAPDKMIESMSAPEEAPSIFATEIPHWPAEVEVEDAAPLVIRGTAGQLGHEVIGVDFPVIKARVDDDISSLVVTDVQAGDVCSDITVEIVECDDVEFCVRISGSVENSGDRRWTGCTASLTTPPHSSRAFTSILTMRASCGSSASMKCPIPVAFGEDMKFFAFFEPKMDEFSLSRYNSDESSFSRSGKVWAGANEFPFLLLFAPRDVRQSETLLVVEFGEVELCMKVCGIVEGSEGMQDQHWVVGHNAKSRFNML
jgi:hypothetical protein